MDIKRAYRFRFYPTPEQAVMLARTFGCARFAYNYMLRMRTDAWQQHQARVGYHETSAALTALKKTAEHGWLNEVSSVPLQQALRHLQTAFASFFAKRTKYPNFRRKDGAQSAEYTASAFRWNGTSLKLAKMNAPLAIRWSRTIPKGAKVTTVTVSKDTAGRYHVSMLCDDVVSAKSESTNKVGIDFGLTDFVVLSTGEKVAAPNEFRKNEAKLAKLQRRLAKKKIGSANRREAKLKVARMHARIADRRRDFLHKLSTRLINENQVIAIESLAVSHMLKNRRLAKSISDAGWSEFVRQLTYKAEWYGRTLIGVDRWYPSSKRCSDCGHTVATLPLKVRAWICPGCGATHDRDINAARNVLAAGLAVSAHGESVIPMSLCEAMSGCIQ
ncbi:MULTISPECIES: RNA-guided endonuclease InsQ/TnpB family protein [Burkholderia]|uniref:RNA-guided endonuclease TnpB family protein n=1 Tax=Burkholderia theae TaxID=3143496 RepID=A0ABU9WAE4_9BURK|nr:RNA-guided endonuclease TnpB family protein [Burkholderia sp. Z1]